MYQAGLGLVGVALGAMVVGIGLGVSGEGRFRGEPPADPHRFYGGIGLFFAGFGLALSTTAPLMAAGFDREQRVLEDYEAAARETGRCPPKE
jgi:hypothetical protein